MKIIIELDKDLNIQCEGVKDLIEALGLLELAKGQIITGVNEQAGLFTMEEH